MDRTTAVEVLTAGKGLATDTMTSPREVYYPEIERVIQKYPYDPGRAEQLMAEAGFKKGSEGLFVGQDGQPIRIMVASSTGARNETEMATYADGLRRAGFDVYQKAISARELAEPQFRALLPGMQIRGGENDLARYTSEQVPRPENRWFGDNRGGWSNAEFDRLNDAILRTLDPAERVKQTAAMERLISTEVPLIPNYFDVYVAAHLANLQGPVGRQAPVQWDDPFMYIYKWVWTS
jgi:peptide/nickel transport system substrate-binding protein